MVKKFNFVSLEKVSGEPSKLQFRFESVDYAINPGECYIPTYLPITEPEAYGKEVFRVYCEGQQIGWTTIKTLRKKYVVGFSLDGQKLYHEVTFHKHRGPAKPLFTINKFDAWVLDKIYTRSQPLLGEEV